MAINNFFKQITLLDNNDEELFIHHEFSDKTVKDSEFAIQSILSYFESKNINPFNSLNKELKNLVTSELVHKDSTLEILNMYENGVKLYETFRNERLIEKSKPLTATVKKYYLPNFKTEPVSEEVKVKKKKNTSVNDSQRLIALAKERDYPLKKLLTYELTYENQLFESSTGLFKKENNKSKLVTELEKVNDYDLAQTMDFEENTCLLIDTMLVVRRFGWKKKETFGDLAKKFCTLVLQKANLHNTLRIDLIFDSYFERSIKSSEHERRGTSDYKFFSEINENTELPTKYESKFWGSTANKIELQIFLRDFIIKEKNFSTYVLIFSTINDSPCISNTADFNESELKCIKIEEADLKLIVHIDHAVRSGCTNIYVISADTDVIVLSLYFFKKFTEKSLKVCSNHLFLI